MVQLGSSLVSDDLLTCLVLDGLTRISGYLAALLGNRYVLIESFRLLGFGQFSGCGFCKHVEYKFGCAHVVPGAFLIQALQVLVLPCAQSRPGFCNLVGQYDIFLILSYSSVFPLIGELFSGTDGHQALVYPLAGVAFMLIGPDKTVGNQFWIQSFLYSVFSDLCKPHFERFGFL